MICRLGTTKATYIRQFEINGLIDSEGFVTSPLFDQANQEQSAKQPIEGTLFEVIDGRAVFNESLGERLDNLNNINYEQITSTTQAPGNKGQIWGDKGDVVSDRTRSQPEKDASRKEAKSKLKGQNIAKASQEAYVRSIGLPPVKKHPYQKSDPEKAISISRTFSVLKSATDPTRREGPLESSIFWGYKEKFPKMMSNINSYRELVEASFAALAKEVSDQYDSLPIRVEYHNGDKNYENSLELLDDVHNYGHLWVFSGGQDHPVMGENTKDANGVTLNEKFRAVHDFYGHAVEGYTFGRDGEENAWIEHSKMFSKLAQLALTTETRGQNSWVNYSGDNEVALEKIKLGATLKREGATQGNQEMTQAGERLLDEANEEFQYAEQKIIVLPQNMTDVSEFVETLDYSGPSYGYHGGNLMDKSDYLTQGYSGDMPYTGYYFFGDRGRAEARGNRSTNEPQVTSVDFSKYNMFRPNTAGYWNLKATLKEITRDMLQGKPFDLSRYGPSDFGSFDIYNELNDKKEEVGKAFKDFKESLQGNFKVERFETTMMKIAGYEGIDVRGLPGTSSLASPDSSSEGSVIFDLKEGTVGEVETISSPDLPTLTKPIGFKSNCK